MPRTPSQKSIDVWRSAPTIVMWWTPWLWSLRRTSPRFVLDKFRLVLAPAQGPPGNEIDARLDDEDAPQPVTDRIRESYIGVRTPSELDPNLKRWLLLHARRLRLDEDMAADDGRERAHYLADGRGKDVHAAHDQHVVGPPDAPHARPRTPAAARARPELDVVARTEAQERRRPMPEMRQHELAADAVGRLEGCFGLRVDHLGMDEAARTEVHPVLLLALAPERWADVADPHRLRDLRSPTFFQL